MVSGATGDSVDMVSGATGGSVDMVSGATGGKFGLNVLASCFPIEKVTPSWWSNFVNKLI